MNSREIAELLKNMSEKEKKYAEELNNLSEKFQRSSGIQSSKH